MVENYIAEVPWLV